MTSDKNYHHRTNDRARRMAGLLALFQEGSLDVRKFRHLTTLIKAEQKSDARESGVKVDAQFK